jgi:hypothetical protein
MKSRAYVDLQLLFARQCVCFDLSVLVSMHWHCSHYNFAAPPQSAICFDVRCAVPAI